MANLVKKKLEAELAAVIAGRLNLEVRIEENLQDIQRLQEHVKIQEDKEKELYSKIQELSNN